MDDGSGGGFRMEASAAVWAGVLFFKPPCDAFVAEDVVARETDCEFAPGLGSGDPARVLERFLADRAMSVLRIDERGIDDGCEILDGFQI